MAWNDETKSALEHFAVLTNPDGAHPLDTERMIDAIIECHRSDTWPSNDEIRQVLGNAVSDDLVDYVQRSYELASELLPRYDASAG